MTCKTTSIGAPFSKANDCVGASSGNAGEAVCCVTYAKGENRISTNGVGIGLLGVYETFGVGSRSGMATGINLGVGEGVGVAIGLGVGDGEITGAGGLMGLGDTGFTAGGRLVGVGLGVAVGVGSGLGEIEDEVGGLTTTSVGVAETLFDAEPEPDELTARILTEYAVPFVSPVIDSGEDVTAGLGVTQMPELSEYS